MMPDGSIVLLQCELIYIMLGVTSLLEAFVEGTERYYGATDAGLYENGLEDRPVPELELRETGNLLTSPLLEELERTFLLG